MSSTAGDLNEDEPSRDSTETYDAVGSEENDKDSSKNGITDSSVPPEMSRNEEKTEVDVSAISGSEDGKIIGTSAGSSNNSEGDTSSTVLKITPEDIPASVENSSAVDNGEVLPKHNNEQQSTSDFESEKAKKSESDDKLAKQKSEGRRKTTESKRRDPQPFVYDPRKITLRFLFANRDGIHVTIDFKPDNTIGEVKAALLSSWPKAIPECSAGGSLRLICMGKGILAPDSRTLKQCDVPSFETHATPVNVAVRPRGAIPVESTSKKKKNSSSLSSAQRNPTQTSTSAVDMGCSCIIC